MRARLLQETALVTLTKTQSETAINAAVGKFVGGVSSNGFVDFSVNSKRTLRSVYALASAPLKSNAAYRLSRRNPVYAVSHAEDFDISQAWCVSSVDTVTH